MAKSQETFNKKEKEKKRLKKRQDKQAKKEERKANKSGGSDLESMMAYVDENGMIVDTPPDPTKKKKVNAKSIELGVPRRDDDDEQETGRQGKVSYFDTSKGFGFILDINTQEKFFVHVSSLTEEIKENDKVTFEIERGQRGMNAVRVKKI